MSTVKANSIAPQSLPITSIDGFNDVESFVVTLGQTEFTSTKFINTTPVRAFKRNVGNPVVWDELTVSFTSPDTFDIVESYAEGEEILVYGLDKYTSSTDGLTLSSDSVTNDSTNPDYNALPNITSIINVLGESARLESYKDYGIGSDILAVITEAQSEDFNTKTGVYILDNVTAGTEGPLLQFNSQGFVKQHYYPFGDDAVYTRDNASGGVFSDFVKVGGGSFVGRVYKVIDVINYTLQAGDETKILRFEGSESTIHLPADVSVNFPIGAVIEVINTNQVVNITPAGGTVTMNSASGLSYISLAANYNSAKIVKSGVNTWDIYGV